MQPSTAHIDNRLLTAYAENFVSDKSMLGHIKKHLSVCQECRHVVSHVGRWRIEQKIRTTRIAS